jgi:tRNA-specific 2-thiouridylase
MVEARGRRVVVAMSGGVDSSTAAYLLTRDGSEVIGLFMRTGVTVEEGAGRRCCSLADAEDARRVAERLGIPFYVLNCKAEFDRLIDYFCSEYLRGRTPNPCIRCNTELKFGKLVRYAHALGAEAVATGHYARVERRDGRWALRRGADPAKDQSYFLFGLGQEQLARARFPLGELTKTEVRALARSAGLPVQEKPESQDICFVPEASYREVLAERLGPPRPGKLVDVSGKLVGEHPGCQNFTIGQRRGLGVALGMPYYVVAIEPETNTVVVGPESALLARGCSVRGLVWGALAGLRLPRPAHVQIRYQHHAAEATIVPTGADEVGVWFAEPQRAITPGQAAVFYQGDVVLGGGWIERVARAF